MSDNILGGLYSFGDRAKRQVRDLASNPIGYAQQSLDEIGRRLRDEPELVVSDAWNASPLGIGAGTVKKVVVDPLAEAIARRMTAQLEQIPTVGGLEALKGVNLPAAYAGDQRSLQAVQRAINKAETGLESPGRRKMLKQTAATAARQMVPEAVDVALGAVARNVAKEAMTSPIGVAEVAAPAAYGVDWSDVIGPLRALKKQFSKYEIDGIGAIRGDGGRWLKYLMGGMETGKYWPTIVGHDGERVLVQVDQYTPKKVTVSYKSAPLGDFSRWLSESGVLPNKHGNMAIPLDLNDPNTFAAAAARLGRRE